MYRLTSLGSPALEKVKSSDIMVMDRWGLQWETGISFLMNHKQVYHLKFTIKVVKKKKKKIPKIKWKFAGVQCISPSVCLSDPYPAWGWWTLWAELHSGPLCCPPEVRHRLCGHKPLRKESRCSVSPLAMRHLGTYRREGSTVRNTEAVVFFFDLKCVSPCLTHLSNVLSGLKGSILTASSRWLLSGISQVKTLSWIIKR